jgi:lysozyme
MKLSAAGEQAIIGFEGMRLVPYKDEGGKFTVGVGHLMQDGDDTTQALTEDEAVALFQTDILHYASELTDMLTVDLRQHEFDALCSWVLNVGHEGAAKSSLIKFVNKEQFADAACQFPAWSLVDGKRSLGLLWRRFQEQKIFLLAQYP